MMLRSDWAFGIGLTVVAALAACSDVQPNTGEAGIAEQLLSQGQVTAVLNIDSEWGSGYCASIRLTNGGSFAVPVLILVMNTNGSMITSLWNGSYTAAGDRVTLQPTSYGGGLASNSTASVGFCANGTARATLVSLTVSGSSGVGGSSPGGGTSAGNGGTGAMGGTSASGGTAFGGASSGTGGSAGATSFCPGATKRIIVASNGSGDYKTVQAAINSIVSNNGKPVEVFVKAGTYKEQVTIAKPYVCLVGESAATTTITNTAGTNIVSGGTVMATANDFSAADIAFANSAPVGSAQDVVFPIPPGSGVSSPGSRRPNTPSRMCCRPGFLVTASSGAR